MVERKKRRGKGLFRKISYGAFVMCTWLDIEDIYIPTTDIIFST